MVPRLAGDDDPDRACLIGAVRSLPESRAEGRWPLIDGFAKSKYPHPMSERL